jgi:hypothetical protein
MSNFQGDWRSCPKCQGMHFAGFPNFKGVCPAGGQHEQTNSFAYEMEFDSAPGNNTQIGWASCPKCQGMHFAGFPERAFVLLVGSTSRRTVSLTRCYTTSLLLHKFSQISDPARSVRGCSSDHLADDVPLGANMTPKVASTMVCECSFP